MIGLPPSPSLHGGVFLRCLLTVLITFAMRPATAVQPAPLQNGYLRVDLQGLSLTALQADPLGKGRSSLIFARRLAPDGWTVTPETRVSARPGSLMVEALAVWRATPLALTDGPTHTFPDRLRPGHTLSQRFRVPAGSHFTTVQVATPTWNTTNAGADLALYRGERRIASRRLTKVADNAWQTLALPAPQGEGEYTVTLENPVGEIGWWSGEKDVTPNTEALEDGSPVERDRTLQVNLEARSGVGRLTYTLDGPVLTATATVTPAPGAPAPTRLPWRWETSWTQSGYDCTPAAGVVFNRFFTDTLRYMPVQQLKRRTQAGLAFDGAKRIEMEGNRDADLALEGDDLHLHWEMAAKSLSLRFDTTLKPSGGALTTTWRLRVLPREDSVPAAFPRFNLPGRALTEDVNRFWWDRAFTYPAPAGAAAWFEWMATMRAWYDGPPRDGEMAQLKTYPITPEGYVHTWGATIGWPFPEGAYDTRHFDTNARYLLACRRFYRWTGDRAFLKSQSERLRRAMRYQLDTLGGRSGLIHTVSKDVNGRHKGVGDNYWDILPFGGLDAYANAVFYGSLEAMADLDRATGAPPLADYAGLRKKVRARYDATFWDDRAGRYIGAVDVDGKRHDYGFTFVNMEALYYGLGDNTKAARIYRWMEQGKTSTGKADTYTRWVFAPRATTFQNPSWGPNAPKPKPGTRPPWWHFGWTGTTFEEQCQDGGAILYTSYFDLMDRARRFGPDNAWKRFGEILARYRLPDRLCGGSPLYRGETPQQENPGSVGLDLPFPESGLVPCYLLYGVMGVEATAEGLRIAPRLPKPLPFAEARGLQWRGHTLDLRVTRKDVTVSWMKSPGRPARRTYPLNKNGVFTLASPPP